MLDDQIARREGALIDYLEPLLAARHSTLDHAQIAALDRLQQLTDELEAFRDARKSTLKRLFAPPDVPRGVYFHGGVGRGKSFLMDAFYASVRVRRKTRIHFHAFMRDVHGALAKVKHEPDPLAVVAAAEVPRRRGRGGAPALVLVSPRQGRPATSRGAGVSSASTNSTSRTSPTR